MMIRALLEKMLRMSGGRSSIEAKRHDWRCTPEAHRNSRRTGTVTASMASHHICHCSRFEASTRSSTTKRSRNEIVTDTAHSTPKNRRVNSRRWPRTIVVRRPSCRSSREPNDRPYGRWPASWSESSV